MVVHKSWSIPIQLAQMVDKFQIGIHNSNMKHMEMGIQLSSIRGLKVHSNKETLKAQHSMRSIQLGMGRSSRSFGSLRSTRSMINLVMVLLLDSSYRSLRCSSKEERWVLHTIGCTKTRSLELIGLTLLQRMR